MYFEKMMKNLDVVDVGLIKLSVFVFTLGIVSYSPKSTLIYLILSSKN